MELTDEQYDTLVAMFPGCSVDVMSHIEEFTIGLKIVVMKPLDA